MVHAKVHQSFKYMHKINPSLVVFLVVNFIVVLYMTKGSHLFFSCTNLENVVTILMF